MEIRQFAVSRKQLILHVCTHFLDAQAKDFCHESMAGAIPSNGFSISNWHSSYAQLSWDPLSWCGRLSHLDAALEEDLASQALEESSFFLCSE
jgi:hypothetical protein